MIGSNVTVPLFTVILRKGYGLGAQGMAGASFVAPFFTISWPTGEFGGMGLEGAVKLGYRNELAANEDPAERKAKFDEMVARSYERAKALSAATLFEFDEVIDPAETRRWIMAGLRSVPAPPKRTGKKLPWIDAWRRPTAIRVYDPAMRLSDKARTIQPSFGLVPVADVNAHPVSPFFERGDFHSACERGDDGSRGRGIRVDIRGVNGQILSQRLEPAADARGCTGCARVRVATLALTVAPENVSGQYWASIVAIVGYSTTTGDSQTQQRGIRQGQRRRVLRDCVSFTVSVSSREVRKSLSCQSPRATEIL